MSEQENQILLRAAAGEFQTPKWNQYARTVKGNDLEIITAEGTFVYVKEASGPLLIAFDGGPDMPVDVGTGMKATRKGDVFTQIIFRNPFATPVDISVWIGYGEFIDNRFTLVPSRDFAIPVIDCPTESLAAVPYALSIVAGTDRTFPGTPAGKQIRRRSLTITNLDPNSRLKLKDKNGNFMEAIEPKAAHVAFDSGTVTLSNDTGADISYYAKETWYMKP